MHIVTFTRSTPDTAARVWVDDNGEVTWGDVATVVNPWDEYSLEETIARASDLGADSTVVAIGGALHDDALKHSIAMGVKSALRIEASDAVAFDSLQWSALAAAAVERLGNVNLIIFGKESVDVATDQHAYQLARRLGWSMLSFVSRIVELDATAGKISVEQTMEQGNRILSAELPAVITVLKGINEPRYPNFLGIRKAARAKIPVWTAADINLELPDAGTKVVAWRNPPARSIETEIMSGASVKEKAEQLAQRLLEEKVL